MRLNGTKTIIPRYSVPVSERINVSYSEIILGFTVIGHNFAWLRKVENGEKSYWKNYVGPINCCAYNMSGISDRVFDLDEGIFRFFLANAKRIDWNKDKGRMIIESRESGTRKFDGTLELRKISPL